MAEQLNLTATQRDQMGTRRSRRLRKDGQIPAVLMYKRETPVHLLVNAHEFHKLIKKGARILALRHPGGEDKVFIKEVQWDHVGEMVLHIDFTKVAKDELITLEVALVLKGKPVGVLESGGVLDQYVKTLKVQCLPDAIPDKIEVAVDHLKLDDKMSVKDLKAPAGVKILADAEIVVAAVNEHVVEEVVPAAAATPGPLEPEVIKKEKAEEVPEEGAEGAKKEAVPKKEAAPKKEEKEKK